MAGTTYTGRVSGYSSGFTDEDDRFQLYNSLHVDIELDDYPQHIKIGSRVTVTEIPEEE